MYNSSGQTPKAFVDRRRESRFGCKEPARVIEINARQAPEEESPVFPTIDAIVLNISGRGMLLGLPQPIDVNATVRVEFADLMVVGQICYCRPTPNGPTPFASGVALVHSILEISALTRLMQRLTEENSVEQENVPLRGKF